MGLFGGSSSRTTSVTNDFTQNAVDNRIIEAGSSVGGNVSIGAGGDIEGLSITTTDFGALDTASEAIDRSLISVDNSVDAVQTIAGDVGSRLNDALSKVTDFATAATGTDQNKTVQYFIMAAAVVGAIWAYKRG